MHTLSTRALSALAFDRGEEYDPGLPCTPRLMDELELAIRARPIVPVIPPAERRRRAAGARRHTPAAVPEWFSPQDLLMAPWEHVHHEPV